MVVDLDKGRRPKYNYKEQCRLKKHKLKDETDFTMNNL